MNDFDANIIGKKVDVIRKRLKRLQKYRQLTVQDYLSNDDAQDIIERNLEVLIQAAVDINKSLLKRGSRRGAEELRTLKNSESFISLAENNILNESLANELSKSGKFRNVLAHLYDEVVPEKVVSALQKALECYPDYLYEIQSYLDSLEN
jgi:uncharacterized protein YutE (UPF0331/DUF86 family)